MRRAARGEGIAPVGLLVVPPGGAAAFGLRWGNWCGPDPGRAGIEVSLSGNERLAIGGIGTPPCLGVGQGSTLDCTPFRLVGPADTWPTVYGTR